MQDQVLQELKKLNAKVDANHQDLSSKIDTLESRFDTLEAKVDANHQELNGKFHQLDTKVDANHQESQAKLEQLENLIKGSVQEVIIGVSDIFVSKEEYARDHPHKRIKAD